MSQVSAGIQRHKCCSCGHKTHKLVCPKCKHRICMICKPVERGRPRAVSPRPPMPAKGKCLSLSSRELEVMRLFVAGSCGFEIAALLTISEKTVSTLKGRAAAKLGLSIRSGDVRIADAARRYIDSLADQANTSLQPPREREITGAPAAPDFSPAWSDTP